MAAAEVWCITGTKICDTFTKMNTIMRSRSKMPKMTPLLVRIFKDGDIGSLPAVKWGRDHEDDSRKTFSKAVASNHKNAKLLDFGLVGSPIFPFIRVIPDNLTYSFAPAAKKGLSNISVPIK